MGTGRGEGGDVVCQTVVGVVQPAVQVGHPVVGLVGQISERKNLKYRIVWISLPLVSLAHQFTAESQSQLGLKKPKFYMVHVI